jgi:hypothetical protein
MNFERGQDPKKALNIGIPLYEIYRIQVFITTEHAAGFRIMGANQPEILYKLSKGELSRTDYLVEFNHRYQDLNGKMEMLLTELPTCFLVYQAEKYLMENINILPTSKEHLDNTKITST